MTFGVLPYILSLWGGGGGGGETLFSLALWNGKQVSHSLFIARIKLYTVKSAYVNIEIIRESIRTKITVASEADIRLHERNFYLSSRVNLLGMRNNKLYCKYEN